MDYKRLGVPDLDEANLILRESEKLNPGPWVRHSIYVGRAAQNIAKNCSGMDADAALVLGMLHDIGRRYGVSSMRHAIDGYNFLMGEGYPMAARICMTHSFPLKDINAVFGKWDCSKEEFDFASKYIDEIVFDDYDRLLQLCDAIALPDGFVLMEKRMMDVALRHGVNKYTVPQWKATFEIKNYFEKISGKSIYSMLPGVIENTFKYKI